ncbi:MAG: ribulose-phosphate 3-epimerase [Bacilli bacterium]
MKLSASFLMLKDKKSILKLAHEDIDYLHLDIMDGIYVENKSPDLKEIKDIVKDINCPLDIHLMVTDVLKYVENYQELKPKIITMHIDAIKNFQNIIYILKENNIKIGLALKPNEDISLLEPFLSYIDLVLIMSVIPGKGGQKFLAENIQKVNGLRQLQVQHNYSFSIAIDGGINDQTIKFCRDCDIIVVGNFITTGNMTKNIKKLKESYNGI